MSIGQLIVGGPSSRTVTVNVQVAEFPSASVAVQVTVVVPTANALPEGGLHETVGLSSQRSVAVGGS
jgi:hypothetical protein